MIDRKTMSKNKALKEGSSFKGSRYSGPPKTPRPNSEPPAQSVLQNSNKSSKKDGGDSGSE